MRTVRGAVLLVAVALVAGCGTVPRPSRVVATPGGTVLVLSPPSDPIDLPAVLAHGELRMIGGRFGCLGFVAGIQDVVVLFPPGSRVHHHRDGPPTVTSGGHTFGVGDRVHGGPLNPQPVRLTRLAAYDQALPSNCVGFAGQAFVDLARDP